MSKVFFKLIALAGLCYFTMAHGECACRRNSPTGNEDSTDPYTITPQTLSLDTAFVPWRDAAGEVVLKNLSGQNFSFSGFQGNCPEEVTWAPGQYNILAGASLTIQFRFEPEQLFTGTTCQLTPNIPGVSQGQGLSKTLTVHYAAGEAKCEVSPAGGLDFGPVEAGGHVDATLSIRNTTTDSNVGTAFLYEFSGASGQCEAFFLNVWGDSTGMVEPGEEKVIPFSFEPGTEGTFECAKNLYTRQAGPLPPPPCPSLVTLRGTGLPGPLPVCSLDPNPSEPFQFDEVQVGTSKELTLTILNQTPNEIPANQFSFLLDNPAGNCDLFTIDPADTLGVIGPGGSKDIVVRFAPGAAGSFQCTRTLSSLREPPDALNPFIDHPCPTEVVWEGTGKIGPPMWSACLPGGSQDLHAIFGLPGGEVYVVGDGGSLATSGGDCQWSTSAPGTDVDLRDIWVHETGTEVSIWAVGRVPPPPGTYLEKGAILVSDGGPWVKLDEEDFLTYASVWGSGPDDVYSAGAGIATDFPNAMHWNGSTLDPLQISDMGMSRVTGLSGTAGNDVWAVLGQSYQSVFRFQGAQWEAQTQAFMTQPLHDVWAVQSTESYAVYAVGGDGAIYHYDGQAWTNESIPGETRDFYGVWVSPTGQVFVVGEDQAIYRGHVNDPTGWAVQTVPVDLPAGDLLDVWGASDGRVFAVGTEGVILRYAPEG